MSQRVVKWDCVKQAWEGGRRIGHSQALLVGPTEVLTAVSLGGYQTDGDVVWATRVMRFDREAGTFTLLPGGFTGRFAVSWDGSRMMRFDPSSRSIKEFTLK